MPWWAKTGPVRIDYHGNPYGEETSGWPAIQDLRPSEQGLLVRLRYGKHDLRKAYEQNLRNGFSEPRAKALYRRDLVTSVNVVDFSDVAEAAMVRRPLVW